MAHLGDQPLRHVVDAGVDAGGGRDAVVGFLRPHRHPGAAAAHVRARPAGACLQPVAAEGGAVHAERVEQALLDLVRVEVAGDREHQVADQAEGDVLVGVTLAGAAGQRRLRKSFRQQRVGLVGLEVAVEGVVGQADAVAEDLAHGDLLRALQVAQGEGGQLVGDRAVPGHRALVHQQRAQRAGEGLGQRGDTEDGVGSDRVAALAVDHAVAADGDDLAVLDDRHRHAGDARLLDDTFGQDFDLARLGAEIASGRRTGGRGQGRGEQEQAREQRVQQVYGGAGFLASWHDRRMLAERAHSSAPSAHLVRPSGEIET